MKAHTRMRFIFPEIGILIWFCIVVLQSNGVVEAACPDLTAPENGSVNVAGVNKDDFASYTCSDGFSLNGTNFRTCQADNSWSDSAPNCVIKDCGTPKDPAGGTAVYTTTTYSSVLTYSCNTGYTITAGSSSANCTGDGWSDKPPTCTIDDCLGLNNITDGTVSAPETTFGATATYTCSTGYYISSGDETRTCQAGGSWNGTEPVCTIHDCKSLSAPSDGSVDVGTTTYDSQATFSCNDGYEINGTATITCQANGKWETSPTCDIKDCGNLTAPVDGKVTYKSSVYNSVATFSCDTGYNLTGVINTTCTNTSTWSDSAPNCTIVDCGVLKKPDNGNVNFDPGTTYGKIASYTCITSHDLKGSNIRKCEADGQWTSSPPTCEIYDCGTPTSPTNGNVSSTATTYGKEATYSCNTGYVINGTSKTTCGKGTWSGSLPTCEDTDECTAGMDNCDTNAACTNTAGSFTCACNTGYNGDGTSCTDINECTAGTDNCDTNAACTNTVGSFTCACNTGYKGDGTSCKDINECTAGTDNCDTNAACTNTVGSFTCACNTGYNGDGTSCTDTDECTAGTDQCDTNAACTNTAGSFTCACNTGYKGDGTTCTDINECTAGTDNCDTNAACTNTAGSFTCACNTGYNGDGTSCTDTDECTAGTDNCDTNAACTNTVGSFTCACNTGYNGDGTLCTDIDECTAGTDNCDTNAACTNTAGSFTCACNTGYNGDGTSCTDVDECTAGTDNCDTNAACTNTVGSFTCACNTGYNGDGTSCTDINECTAGTDNCDTNAACTNTAGSFTCACNTGYNGDGTSCKDIDECTAGTDNCDTNAACTNTAGSFTCACNTGYNGDGTSCTDVDECTAGTDNCDTNAACTNTAGSFTCACNTGYKGDGTTCTDINECTAGTDNCDTNAACTNTAGSFTCACNKGYSGNGTSCQDCGKLNDPANGSVNQTGTTYNKQTIYVCNEGYENTGGDLLRVCQADGSWNGTEVVCTIEDCGNLTTPSGGSVSYKNSTYGEIATYSCNTGYQQAGGEATRTCVQGGVWNGTEIVCQIYTCPNATDPTNGTVVATGYTYGENATFSCDTGFDLDRNSTLTCGLGTWDSTFPTCVKKDCGALSTKLADANVTQSGTKYLDTTLYTCDTGYMIAVGNVSLAVTCQSDGNWSDSVPTCIQTDCGSLSKPENGQVNTQPGTTYLKLASYTCNQGYNLNGTNVRECQANGYWDGAKPTCQIIDCGNLTNPKNGLVDTSSGTTFFQVASYSCDTGYELSDTSGRSCQLDGNWNGTEPSCSKKNCGSLSTVISNGKASQSGTLYEDTTVYTCNTGHYISQGVVTQTVTCLDMGKWNGTTVMCIPVDCMDLAAPSGGQIMYKNTFYNTRASYTCNPGHDLNGTNVRTCRADGFWDNSEPECVIKDCGVLKDIGNGSVSAPVTTYGQAALYTCDLGYYIATGSQSRKCNESGQWEGTEPTCDLYDCGTLEGGSLDSVVLSGTTYNSTAVYTCNTGYYVTDGNLTRTCGDGNWSGTPPTCTIRDCGKLSNPENGTVTVTLTTYLSVADYKCKTGFYNSSGDWQRTCQADGTWSGTELQCLIYDCSVPSDTGNGTVSYTSTTFGSSATYRCNEGFYTKDTVTVTCGNGAWDGSVPVCTIYDCRTLKGGSFDSVVLSGTTYNSTAVYTCNTGYYVTDGNLTRTCGDGNWSGTPPTCTIRDCGKLSNPENGTVTVTLTTYLSVADYKCKTGFYNSSGDWQRTCQADGTWSGTELQCLIYDCSVPSDTGNGTVSYSSTTFGSSATYRCNEGFYTKDIVTVTCGNGAWDGSVPVCTIYDCGDLSSVVVNGSVVFSGTTYNETAIYTCNDGFLIPKSRNKNMTLTCLAGGNWDDSVPTCVPVDCGRLDTPLNGDIDTSKGTGYLKVAAYTCNKGYRLEGINIRTCQADDNWSDKPPVCMIYDCKSPPEVANGTLSVNVTTYSATVTYTCNTGFNLSSGNEERTCDHGGSWNGTLPTCTLYDCGSLTNPENGTVTLKGQKYGDTAMYNCDKGYNITAGDGNRTCGEGTWGGQEPTCSIRDCGQLRNPENGQVLTTNGTTYMQVATYTCDTGYYTKSGDDSQKCEADGTWSGEPLVCAIYDCGYLFDITNGNVTLTGTTYNETASYKCKTGHFISSGDQTRTCREFWTGSQPVCTIYNCGSAGSLENGGVVAIGTQYNDKATYICNEGYLINGTETNTVQRVCEEGGKWSGQLPTCFLVDCGILQSPANGKVDLSQGTGLNDMAAYTCNKGYRLEGKNVRACQPSNIWEGQEPACIIKDCGTLDNPTNGVVTLTGTAYQETATYTCNNGFYISAGNQTRSCRSVAVWDGAEPVCTKNIETTPDPSIGDEMDMVCGHRNEDLVFGIAVSAMTTEDDFTQMKNLVINAIYRSDIDPGDMQIGVFVYSSHIDHVIHLNAHTASDQLIQAVNAIPYNASDEPSSQLSVGLTQIPAMFNTSVGDRPEKLNYVFLIMDDSVNMTGSIPVADEIREAGIHLDIFAIGFSNASQLADIAFKPNGHIFPIQTYDIMKLYVQFVLWKNSRCDCGTLTAPVDGDVSMTGSFYLDTATFVCEHGYNLTGSQTLTCQYGGSWTGSPPTCIWGDSETTQTPLNTTEPDQGFCGYMNGDMIIAIGVSRTVDEEEFKQTKTLVKNIIDHSDLDRGSTRIGLFVFDSLVRRDTLIGLNDFETRADLLDEVNKLQYRKSENSLELSSALQQIKTLSADRRNGTLLLTYVILDDDVSYTGSQALADQLREMGIIVSFMAIEFTNTDMLKSLAFVPRIENIMEIPNYDTAEVLSQSQFKDETCNCGLPSIPFQGSVTVTGTYFLDVATFSCDVGYDLVGSRQLMCENGGMWNGSYPTCSPKVTIAPTPNPTPGIDTTCGLDSLDVVFGIGVSDIMTESEFSSLKNFVFNAIHRSNIDFGITRFGFFLFNKEVITEFVIHLKQYRTRADLILAIDSIPFEPSLGPGHLAIGLQYLLTMFTAINGARTGISNMAVIMLDNSVDIGNSSSIASQLKVSRISLQFMTVGFQNVTQLENMGSGETSVSNANSYGFLEWIVENGIYRDEICSCGGIDNPDFGSVVVTGSYFLDVASFRCIDGYELIGSQQLVCQYDHVWSGTPPTCTRTGVVSPPGSHINPKTACGFSNADVVVGIATSSLTTETEFRNLISLVKSFITLSDIDSGSTHFGFFMFDALVYTSHVISLGQINTTADLLAEVNNIPYKQYRSKTRLELGLNQVLEMFSAKVGRNRPDVPDHVFILTGTDVLYYDVFSAANQIRDSGIMLHIIADGYNPVLSSLVFGADGHFIELPALDREAFIAQKLFRHSKCNCGEVFGPGNGSVSYKQAETGEVSTFYLDVATFTCDAGFQLVGSPQLVCQDDGNWAGTVPTCRSQGVTAITSVKPTTPGQLVTDKDCGFQNIDVIYGVGLSSHISETDFENIKNLIKIGIDHANIEMGSAQLGFFIYANGVTLMQVALDEYMTRSDIFSALDSFKYHKDDNQVSLSTGLNIAKNMFSSLTNNAGAPDYLYMIMDHSVDIEGASEIVEQIRAADIHVDFIAVGLDHSSELHKFAHVEEIDSFDTTEMAITAGLFFRTSKCNCSGLQSPDNGKVVYDDTYFLDVAAFSCNQGYDMVGSQQLVCQNRGVWSGSPPVCVPKGSKKEVDVLISLNMTTRADVDLKKNDTYNTYKEAVKLALEKHYRDLLKDDNVTIIINGLSFGSLNVNFTIVISNTAESVENFTKSTVNLAKGVSIEVLNESLAVTNMSVGENSVNIVTMTEEALTCMVFIEANGPCDLGHICQLVDDVPNCVPDPDTDCGFPGSVLNGKVLTVDGTLYGESATFSCNYGYRLEGNHTLICMPSGFWVPEVPTCTYIDCGNLTSPENGMVNLPGGTGYRQPANFSCYPGYTLVGQAELLCTKDSKWSGIAPTCQINDNYCGAVLDPQHGSVWTTDLSRINSTATFICNNGYRMEGPGTRDCSGNTNWEPVQDTKCIIKDCGILRNPLNGSVDQSSGTTFGQTVVFSCSVGYKLFGAEQATCMADGNWSTTPPECQITNCGGLSNPANGLVSASQTTFGQRATYVCNPGYKIQGISTRTCQPDGSWSVREPTCLPLDCGALFDPSNGIVNTTSGTTFGNLATYSCNEGYKLEGQAVTECEDTGIWNPSVAPKCDIIDCGQLQDLQYGSVTVSKGTKYQSVATYQCNTGYTLKGPSTRECLDTEEWSNKQQQSSCSIIDCGSISQPMDGSISLTNNTVYQSVAQFTCNNGYKLSGPISRTCSISGNWEPNQASSCSLQNCGRIQNPVNGNVDQSSGTTYGRTVHFNCSVGYEIFGSKQATCKADGQWSHAAPVCRITDCKGLPNPDNGTVSASETTFGQVASYTCNEGFTLQGTSSRFCQPDGSWSGSTPTCMVKDCGSLPDPAFGKVEYASTIYGSEAVYKCNVGYSLQGLTTRKCEADRNWSGVTPTCTIIDCGSLSAVESGSYTPPQRNTYNTAVIISCNTGYQLNGNATVTCLETGQWSPLPTCTIRDCGELTEPENGLLSLPRGTTYGQTAVFTCKTGYILSGSTQLQCLQDGFWSGTPPICRLADCGILNDPTNGAVTLSGTSFGDYATYVCDAGHHITGSPSRLCQETAEWSGSQPSCEIRDCGRLTAPAGGNVTLSGTKYGNVATFTCNTGYNVVGLSTVVCRADGFWSAEPPTCTLQVGLLAKELIVTLNMTAPPGLTLSNPFTYEAYRKEVKVALEQHYGLRLKDNIIDIIINSMSLGSLIVDYTVVMKDKAEAVKNFSQASMELAQGSTLEVFNQNLGVDKMTANNDPEDLKSLQSDELVCRLFLDLAGPCQTGYVCTLVNDSPECRPDPSIDCGIPPIPLNGELDYARGTLYGETVIYTCISGYTLTGANTRTCQVDGSWQPPAPTCSLTDCGSLNNPDNGRVIYGGTVIGQTAFFSCDAGYSLIGATVITCQLDGSWNNPPPSCAITGCGGLQSPLHGFVSISFDSRSAMYSCDTGYILNGDEIRNCLTSNVWSGITPTCKAIVCPLLPNPQYGSVTLSGTSFDDTATYQCTREGYRLSGTDTRKCSGDGQWSARAPTCDIIECADLPDFPNGNMVMSGKTYGQTVSYTCNQGYILDGATTLKCEENGWSNSPPTCKLQGDCGPLQNPTYGYITFTLGTAYLSKATYVCYIGYKLTGNAERECQADNTWSGSSVTCVNVDCGQPPSPGEGTVSYGSGTTYGRVATYTCNSGYDLIGQTSVTCQNNGSWPNIPVCRPKDCGILTDPLNGIVDTVTGTTFGYTALYTCNPGFYLMGVSARTCLATGFWDNLEPVCAVRDCGPLATPTNGVVNIPSGTTFGQTATYICRPGYILSGAASRQCTVDGTWTDSPPICTAIICVMPANPGNGQVSVPSGLGVGSVAKYSCNPGYVISPASNVERTCMMNGNWTAAQPACIFVDCGSLSAPMFGDVLVDQTSFGHTATYVCKQGYIISGTTERTCSSDGTWSGTKPVCTVSDCGTLANPTNGEVKMPDGTLFGATAVYTCNSGYSTKDYYKRTCLSNGTWSSNAPTCQSSREFALAVGLGVGLTGFVILVLTIVLIIVIMYRRNHRSKRYLRKPSRVYTLSQPLMAPSLPVKMTTSRPLIVPYYSGPTLMDDGVDEDTERKRTWRSRKADYGDPTNPLYYNSTIPRHEYYSFER